MDPCLIFFHQVVNTSIMSYVSVIILELNSIQPNIGQYLNFYFFQIIFFYSPIFVFIHGHPITFFFIKQLVSFSHIAEREL